jgi:oligosaccharide repeat unit polymerase
MVAIFTFVPLLFFHFQVPGTYGLAKDVGANLELYVYAFLCVASFYGSFIIFSKGLKYQSKKHTYGKQIVNSRRERKLRFNIIVYTSMLIIVGAIATMITMQYMDLTQLQTAILQYEDNPELRLQLLTADVPGIIRMLNYLIPSAIIILFGIISSYKTVKTTSKWFLFLFLFVLLGQLARSMIWMDRNSLLMIIVIGVISVFPRFLLTRSRLFFLAAFLLAVIVPILYVAKLQSTIRGDELLETISIFHYADLGVANASLASTTNSQFALGMESLFTAISTVPRGIGLDDIVFPISNREWIHNNAANLLTYSLGDFGYFGFLTYIIWGAVAGRVIYKKITNPESLTWNIAYLWLIYAIATIWTIPISRGPDYWCGVIFSMLVAWRLDKIYHLRRGLNRSNRFLRLPSQKA